MQLFSEEAETERLTRPPSAQKDTEINKTDLEVTQPLELESPVKEKEVNLQEQLDEIKETVVVK